MYIQTLMQSVKIEHVIRDKTNPALTNYCYT